MANLKITVNNAKKKLMQTYYMNIDQWPSQNLLEHSLNAMRGIVGSLVIGNAVLKSLAECLQERKREERERKS